MTTHVKRKPVVLQVRCKDKGHIMLSIHHTRGTSFEVIRAAGRAGGSARDEDSFLRNGSGTEMNFETVPALARSVSGQETATVAGLLGDSPWIFCRCGAKQLDEATADAIGDVIGAWHEAGQNTTRPATITIAV